MTFITNEIKSLCEAMQHEAEHQEKQEKSSEVKKQIQVIEEEYKAISEEMSSAEKV